MISARASATRCCWPPDSWLGLAPLVAGQLDESQKLANLALDLSVGDLLAAQAEGDVLVHVEMREQRVVLEDRVDVASEGRRVGHVLLAQLDRARADLLEAGDHAQRRRLAAAGRSEHREELAALDVERQVVDRGDVVEALADALDANVGSVCRARLSRRHLRRECVIAEK